MVSLSLSLSLLYVVGSSAGSLEANPEHPDVTILGYDVSALKHPDVIILEGGFGGARLSR
jgi:hypothetical protein